MDGLPGDPDIFWEIRFAVIIWVFRLTGVWTKVAQKAGTRNRMVKEEEVFVKPGTIRRRGCPSFAWRSGTPRRQQQKQPTRP